jgi:hypothetical protein
VTYSQKIIGYSLTTLNQRRKHRQSPEGLYLGKFSFLYPLLYVSEDRDEMHSTSITKNLSGLKSLIRRHRSRRTTRTEADGEESLLGRLLDVFLRTWDLGFTAFGGPPVHFGILHNRFVEGTTGEKWVDEQTVRPFFNIYTVLIILLALTCGSTKSCLRYVKHFRGRQARKCCFASHCYTLASFLP